MLEKRGKSWGSGVRVIGISLDRDKKELKKHIEEKELERVEHYVEATSNCSQVYGVQGIPHMMLIDKSGKIAFIGHPAQLKHLEKDIDKLLQGQKIESINIDDDMDEDEDIDFEEMDSNRI